MARQRFVFNLNNAKAVRASGHKAMSLRFLKRHGFRVPVTYVCASEAHHRHSQGDARLQDVLRAELEAVLSPEKSYAVRWLGSLPNRAEVARRASPIHYVRKDMPPILTIHGDADPTVPYQHAIDYHKALQKAGVPNQLVTVPGGKHGGFTADEYRSLYKDIFAFLSKHGVL